MLLDGVILCAYKMLIPKLSGLQLAKLITKKIVELVLINPYSVLSTIQYKKFVRKLFCRKLFYSFCLFNYLSSK